MKKSSEQRFLEKIKKTRGCWHWKPVVTSRYGHFKANHKKVQAHRYSYELHKGPIPKGLYVCHSCDNPKCVNPNHLWLGTQFDNIQDCIKKGRKRVAKGEASGRSKLTSKKVLKIRELLDNNKDAAYIAKRFKITTQNIHYIKIRATWNHI